MFDILSAYCYMYYAGRLTRIMEKTQMLLEAKIGSYKVYDEGIQSLMQIDGWVTDEVRVCNNYEIAIRMTYICCI